MFKTVTRAARIVALGSALAAGVVAAPMQPAQAATLDTATYVVLLDPTTIDPAAVAEEHRVDLGADIGYVYRHAVKGYSATLSPAAVTALRADSRVDLIERDQVYSASTTQSTSYWNLDRSDQRALPLSGTYTYTATGSGITTYVIDTGIRFTHTQFGGRAVSGYDAVDGGTADDCNGHGTHVAGTVGGSTVGFAKATRIVGVRVLDCNGNGTTSGVVAGVDWTAGNHAAGTPAVANMSLGGGASSAIDTAVSNLINDGVTTVVAAGNGNFAGVAQDACNYSPARVSAAITIGATDKSDKKARFSNYGNCVDFFAPGVGITSSWYTGDTAGAVLDGTSMASPAVAGVAAMYLQNNTAATPASVRTALYNLTTKGVVTSSSSVNNHLLFTNL